MIKIFLISLLSVLACSSPSPDTIRTHTFKRLASIRTTRKQQVIDHFARIQERAVTTSSDPIIATHFKRIHTHAHNHLLLNFELDRHFVLQYGDFYDMLFVDTTGAVFHSIKKESDYGSNLFTDATVASSFATYFKRDKGYTFTDYTFYHPSQEPAAFFITTLYDKEIFRGWIVLQCPLNRVNRILTSHYKKSGRTGEVYLVNQNNLMLSDSRFIEDSSILRLQIHSDAVTQALLDGYGERMINDYRGVRVYSSYEKFRCFGSEWIIIAEIDEDEIITDYYRQNHKKCAEKIEKHLSSFVATTPPINLLSAHRVDINEFARIDSGALQTHGVGSCTGLLLTYPNRFTYMAHIGPIDRIYTKTPLDRFLLRKKMTSYLTDLIAQIRYHHVLPAELRNIQFHIITPHTHSYHAIIQELIANGIELSQIFYHYNPQSDCANIHYNLDTDVLNIEWVRRSTGENSVWEKTNVRPHMGHVLQKVSGWGA